MSVEGTPIRRPALAPWVRTVQRDDRLLLEHGGSLVALEGRAAGLLLPALVPLLDGTRTVEEIVDALGAAAEPSIRRALDLLDRHALLVDERGETFPQDEGAVQAARFAAACGSGRLAPMSAGARIAASRVEVAGSAPAAREVVRLLRDAGAGWAGPLGLDEAPGEADLLVAAPDRDELELLPALNERGVAERRPWLQLLPHDGRFGVVGPVFLPGDSACYECYRMRRAAASGYEEDFYELERVPTRGAAPAALAAVTAGLGALLAIRWLATRDASLPGVAYSIGTRTVLELTCHRVLRVPRCAACGIGPEALPTPWYKEAARAG